MEQEMCGRLDCPFRTTACTAEASAQCGIMIFIRDQLPGQAATFVKTLWESDEVGDVSIPHRLKSLLTPAEWHDQFQIQIDKFILARVPPRRRQS